MALAAEDFADLYESMGMTGTAAGNLISILDRLSGEELSTAKAARVASDAGRAATIARTAQAASANAAAAAEQRLATAQKAASVTSKTAPADIAKKAAEQKKADQKIMADSLAAMKARDERMANSAAVAEKTRKSSSAAEQLLSSALLQTASSSTAASGAAGKLQGILGRFGPYGQIAAIGIGLVTIAITALVAATVKIANLAIVASQAKDRLRDFFGAMTGTGATGGVMLIGQLDRLAKQLNTTSAQLEPYAKRLLAVRMPAQDLDGALKAITASSALMGEQGGAAAANLYEEFQKLANMRQRVILSPDMQTRLAQAGVSAKALAKELGVTEDRLRFVAINAKGLGDVMQRILLRQGAGALQAMGRSWDTISARFKEGINDAFSGLSDIVSPFMEEVQKLASEFYKGSAGSGILSGAVRGVLEPAFKTATAAVRVLHIALLYVQIYALKAYIALRPLWDILGELEVGAKASWVALYVLKGTLVVLAVIFGVLAVAVALVALPFVVLGIAIAGVVAAVQYLYGVLSGAVANIDNIKTAVLGALAGWAEGALTAAGDFVTGLVQGIAAGAGAVANAVKQLAMGALSAFTSTFGIKSPSTVMRKHGKVNIAEEGLGGGIDQGRGKVEKSMRALTAPPKKGSAGAASGKSSGLFGSIGQVVFNYYGKKDDFEDFAEKAEAWLEQLAMSGPEPEPEAT